jgi:hypothetical protein
MGGGFSGDYIALTNVAPKTKPNSTATQVLKRFMLSSPTLEIEPTMIFAVEV